MRAIASQITSLTIVYSIAYSDADQRKYQSSASLAFVRGNHRSPVNSPHKWPVTRKKFPFDDVIMIKNDLICSDRCCLDSASPRGWLRWRAHSLGLNLSLSLRISRLRILITIFVVRIRAGKFAAKDVNRCIFLVGRFKDIYTFILITYTYWNCTRSWNI